jgi:hypothetical protein
MVTTPKPILAAAVAVATLGATTSIAAQPGPPTPTTSVLATLTMKPDISRADVMKSMPDEVRATIRLYLEGKILQWYGRADGKGVVFIVNASSVDDAKKALADLPFEKMGMVTFDYVALTPLTPLRVILPPSQ